MEAGGSIEPSLSNEHTHTHNSIQSQELKTTENGGEYVHRLVQDENAKTILLNVPLEINSTSGGSAQSTINGIMDCAASTTSSCSSMSSTTLACSSFIPTSAKPPRRPGPTSSSRNLASVGVAGVNGEAASSRQNRKKTRVGGAELIDIVLASKISKNKSRTSSTSSSSTTVASRVRSASVGRDKKSDLQARYWAFLFENVRRAVDDLYMTCESDESIPATKEVILVFENYVRDFRNLANWLKLKWEYENTPPPQRPTSLAWEVRKTPPAAAAKLTPTSLLATQRLLMATPAKRQLDFEGVLSPNGSKKVSSSSLLGCDKIDEPGESPVDQNDFKLGTEDTELIGSTFQSSDATSQKIKEFTPVKEEETGTIDLDINDSKQTEEKKCSEETEKIHIPLIEEDATTGSTTSDQYLPPSKSEKLKDEEKEMNAPVSETPDSRHKTKEVSDIVENFPMPDETSALSKQKNEQNAISKSTIPKTSNIISAKGYSAVTKASMNRAKTNSLASHSVITPNNVSCHNKSCSVPRSTGTTLSNKVAPYGSRTQAPSTGSGNKSMTSSTSSTASTTDVTMSASHNSTSVEKTNTAVRQSIAISAGNPKKSGSVKVVASSSSAAGINSDSSPKAQRLSLVQRQAKFAVSASSTSNTNTISTKGSMTRSATTPAFSYRGRGIINNNTRPQTAKLSNSKSSMNRGLMTSNRNHVQLKASNSTPVANQNISKTSSSNNQASALQPFGSTSSISSSGSSRSWADTVKGLKLTNHTPSNTKSVENISMKNTSHEQDFPTDIEDRSISGNQDDGGEWETVRPRTRSKVSPLNSQFVKTRSSMSNLSKGGSELKRSSSFNDSGTENTSQKGKKIIDKTIASNNVKTNISNKNNSNQNAGRSVKASKQYIKERFQLPSSAVSMPSLDLVMKSDKVLSTKTKSEIDIEGKQEKKISAVSKPLTKGTSSKDKRAKELKSAHRNSDNSANQVVKIDSAGSSESLAEKSGKGSVKSTKSLLKNRSSINNRGDMSTKERNNKLSVKKDKPMKSFSSDQSKNNMLNTSSKDSNDNDDNSDKSLKNCIQNENDACSELINSRNSDKSDNKENIPLEKIEYETISSSYPHQLDTCLEDDESEGDTAENEADSELAENEAAIALVEEEEEILAREIKETECSQLVDDALDSANECDQYEVENNEVSEKMDCGNFSTSSSKLNNKLEVNSENCGDMCVKVESNEPCTPSKYEALFEGLSWIDQIELEEQLVEARMPGRAIEIHEKLSSPARKREPHEAFKHHQEKQNKARVRRQMFQDEKAQRLVALNTRIEEVIAHREFLLSKRREMIMKKMAKAEAKRQEHIDGIRKKAGEEEAKLKEIAFINELSAQNTRFDMLAQNQAADEKAEERLAEFAGERAKKAEQREAKEARAEERRRKLEDKRIKDVEALRIKILKREERIQEEQEQIRKDREEAAREKNRDREEKLSTVRAAEKDMKEELQEKIQQKMEEAAKRHQEKLQQVRHKAFELSIKTCSTEEGELEGGALLHPMLLAYDPKKKCEVCGILIHNEVQLQSHLRGKKHSEKLRSFVIAENEGKSSRPSSSDNLSTDGRKMSGEEVQKYNLRYIVDAPVDELDPKMIQLKERNKAMKKRAKKIKTRMAMRAAEYEKMLLSEKNSSKVSDAPHKAKIGKSLRDIEKLIASQGKGAWPNNSVSSLERALGEIVRSFQNVKSCSNKESHSNDKVNALITQDKHAFFDMNGFNTLSKLFQLLADATPSTGIKIDQRPVCVIPLKSIVLSCKTWTSACCGHRNNTEFVLKSNYLSSISDILHHRLHILIPETPDSSSKKKIDSDSLGDQLPAPEGPQVDPVAKAIMTSLAQCLEDLAVYLVIDHENKIKTPKTNGQIKQVSAFDDLALRVHDQVSYMIAIGIVDKLAAYFHSVQDPIDGRPEVGEFLLASLDLMSALTVCVEALATKSGSMDTSSKVAYRDMSSSSSVADGAEGSVSSNAGSVSNDTPTNMNKHIANDSSNSDPTYLLSTLQMTDLAGTISMLYGILLHQGATPRLTGNSKQEVNDTSSPKLSNHTLNVVAATAKLLHRMLRQYLSAVQEVLGQEGISLEFRHIASYLLWYCQTAINASNKNSESEHDIMPFKSLLHEVITLVGYFAARHQENQTIVQSGHRPSVLEQLCNLPFPYFSQPELKRILFPTLLACCFDNDENRAILQEEMNWQLIDEFLYSPIENGKNEHLSSLVLNHR